MITRDRIRRLRKKLEQLGAGAAWLENPTDEELAAVMRKNPRAIWVQRGLPEEIEREFREEETPRKSRRR
jgi:molybdopterin-biosynthesis enzyme MoeA-like protein